MSCFVPYRFARHEPSFEPCLGYHSWQHPGVHTFSSSSASRPESGPNVNVIHSFSVWGAQPILAEALGPKREEIVHQPTVFYR